MASKSYRDLDVWREAVDLATAVYQHTRLFPGDERFGLTQQIQRAVVSIASNVAEGQGRKSTAEFAYFIRVARGSLHELETQLLIAKNLGYVSEIELSTLDMRLKKVGQLANGLLRFLEEQRQS